VYDENTRFDYLFTTFLNNQTSAEFRPTCAKLPLSISTPQWNVPDQTTMAADMAACQNLFVLEINSILAAAGYVAVFVLRRSQRR